MQNMNQYNESKTGVGVLLGFLSLAGLIVGLLLYPAGTYSRQTFIKSWAWTFGITIVLGIIIGVIYYFALMNQINNIVSSYPYY